MTTVALDGRGAERGPEAIVGGARAAAADGIRVRVFGDPAALSAVGDIDGAQLVPATQEITNADEPVCVCDFAFPADGVGACPTPNGAASMSVKVAIKIR